MPDTMTKEVIEVEPSESEAGFMRRCMADDGMEATHDSSTSRRAACALIWNQGAGGKAVNEELLRAIKEREKSEPFGYGILTADRYVKTVQECVGSDLCYRYAASKSSSFDDIIRKAAKTLVYSNQDMVVVDQGIEFFAEEKGAAPKKYEGIELPKNTLMVFRHVLTTPRKDRDGDILRTQGAVVDPKMLLLWQHVHTLPIGKMLLVEEQNSKQLSVVSCIVDMNDLSHDAAVMVDSGMGRFSHGFRALEFNQMKAEGSSPGGFDVKRFEIMEESLVSVPSNTDADTQEILLGLVEGGKLTSPMMKAAGASIREKRNPRVPVIVDIKLLLNGKEIDGGQHGHEETKAEGNCGCGGSGTSKEADEAAANKAAADAAKVKADLLPDMKPVKCPECGGKMVEGKCKDCGYMVKKDYSEKAGRVLSAMNEKALQEAHDTMGELHDMSGMSRQQQAMCKRAQGYIKGVLDTVAAVDESGKSQLRDITVEQAMSRIITDATPVERSRLIEAITAIEHSAQSQKRVEDFRAFVGSH